MNRFGRKATMLAACALAGLALAGCGSAEKRYAQAVQDTNDRIERMRRDEAQADAALAEALKAAAAKEPALVAAVASNIMMARAVRAAGGASGQAFIVPQRPVSFGEEARAWIGTFAPFLVTAYQANRSAYVQVKQGEFDYLRFLAAQTGETSRVSEIANMAVGLKPDAPQPNVTTYNFGRDGNVGNGTQQNDNSSRPTCTAGSGANGGGGGAGGTDGGGGAPGAPGAAGGSGGNAC